MAAIFQPTLLDWLFGSGIGTNLGASLAWVLIGAGIGWLVRRAWERHKKRTAEHEEWTARHLARLMHRHGVEVDAHPHHRL